MFEKLRFEITIAKKCHSFGGNYFFESINLTDDCVFHTIAITVEMQYFQGFQGIRYLKYIPNGDK